MQALKNHNVDKAKRLIQEGEKKLSNRGFFGSAMSVNDKLEDAIDCYEKAGAIYKQESMWTEAGNAYNAVANLHSTRTKEEAAKHFIEAGYCYKNVNVTRAAKCFQHAIEIYLKFRKLPLAAKYHRVIGEIYECSRNYEQSLIHYQEAADLYNSENLNHSFNKCIHRVALVAALLGRYEKAIKLFQNLSMDVIDNSLVTIKAKNFIFRALLCYLCLDTIAADKAYKKFVEVYHPFEDTLEAEFFKRLVDIIAMRDKDDYLAFLEQYSPILQLDSWHKTLLERVAKKRYY